MVGLFSAVASLQAIGIHRQIVFVEQSFGSMQHTDQLIDDVYLGNVPPIGSPIASQRLRSSAQVHWSAQAPASECDPVNNPSRCVPG
jgi:hypothetical protein